MSNAAKAIHLERMQFQKGDSEGKDQNIKTGRVISIVGDQLTTGTPKENQGRSKFFSQT